MFLPNGGVAVTLYPEEWEMGYNAGYALIPCIYAPESRQAYPAPVDLGYAFPTLPGLPNLPKLPPLKFKDPFSELFDPVPSKMDLYSIYAKSMAGMDTSIPLKMLSIKERDPGDIISFEEDVGFCRHCFGLTRWMLFSPPVESCEACGMKEPQRMPTETAVSF